MIQDSSKIHGVEEKILEEIENMSRTELETVLKHIVEKIFSTAAIDESAKGQKTVQTSATVVQDEDKFSEKRIADVLLKLGIPASLKGYRHLKTAIPYYALNEECSMTKDLYPHVARLHSTTSSRVERAIRHSIEVCFDRGNPELIEKYLGNSTDPRKGKTTNSEFIAAIWNSLGISDNSKKKHSVMLCFFVNSY